MLTSSPGLRFRMLLYCVGVLTGAGVQADTLFVSNYGNNTISKVTADGGVTLFATVAAKPYGLAFDSVGNLYVASGQLTNRLTRITPAGAVSTFTSLPAAFDATGLAFDSQGTLYLASQNGGGVRRVAASGFSSTFFTNRTSLYFGLVFDQAGSLYFADAGGVSGTVKKVGADRKATNFVTGLSSPWGLAVDAAGNLFVSNLGASRISKISPAGVPANFASGFNGPAGLAFDTAGILYVANSTGNTISRVTPAGVVSGFAAGLNQPQFIAVQPDLSPPSLTLPAQAPDALAHAGATLELAGALNGYYEILGSTNLVTWAPFLTNQIVASATRPILDPDATNRLQRFYRARQLP